MVHCKHNLQAIIIWPKGATPLSLFDLRKKLSSLWKNFSKWGVIYIGKGYYEFVFTCLEDVKRVRSIPSWNLNPGFLKHFAWSKDFNPTLQSNTSAQVWLRIYGLSQEYWRPKILFAIANSVGTPICTDAATSKPMLERTFGLYARVLIDLDVTQPLRHKVLVERKNFAFFVDFEYDNLPDFCSYCKKIGHYVEICKSINREKVQYQVNNPKKVTTESKKEFIVSKDGRKEQGKYASKPIVVEDVPVIEKLNQPTNKGKNLVI